MLFKNKKKNTGFSKISEKSAESVHLSTIVFRSLYADGVRP